MNARQIEIAVATLFNWRQNVIVPNVAWGWGLRHEADMVILRRSGWAIEIEIKCTASDILADLEKRVPHLDNNLIRQCYFAVPTKLINNPNIPPQYGLIEVMENNAIDVSWKRMAHIVRVAKINKKARKTTEAEQRKLSELGAMRIWELKKKLELMRESKPIQKKART